MGVKYLNTLIKKQAPNALKYVALSTYAGKTIAIDTSIYMHKYLVSNSMMESMYFMMVQFKYLNVTPIFVFDGCAPEEKRGTLNARDAVRQNAMQKYYELQDELLQEECSLVLQASKTRSDEDTDSEAFNEEQVQKRMRSLKRRFLRVTGSEVSDLKRLMREYGIQYIECDTESDMICAYLVKSGIAHVCMSDDMDMFLYGCPVVLRDVNIWHGTGTEYTLNTVLNGFGISMQGFRMACVLSGTDYTYGHGYGCNRDEARVKFYLTNLVNSYVEYTEHNGSTCDAYFDAGFYEWVVDAHNKQVSTATMNMFEKAYSIFSSEPSSEMKDHLNANLNLDSKPQTQTRPNNYETPLKVKRIMAKYNFIYII